MSGMASWFAYIRKEAMNEQWGNRYVIRAASLSGAMAIADQIVAKEKAIHLSNTAFLDVTLEPVILGAGGGTVYSIGGNGAANVALDYLPLFNVVRVWLRPENGKPSQKYLRNCGSYGQAAAGVWVPSFRNFIRDTYALPLLAIPGLVDVDNQVFLTTGVAPKVGEHQLRRKRRPRPGMKRGWVPK